MVKKKKVSVFQAIIPVATMARRSSVVVLILLSLLFAFISKTDNIIIEKTRVGVMDVVSSIYDILINPVDSFNKTKDEISHWVSLYDENTLLREQNQKLQSISYKAWLLEKENTILRKQLAYVDGSQYKTRLARIVGGAGELYRRQGYIYAGRKDHITKGQIVMDNNGLLGRIQDVGNISSRIMFITDINSRIPVVTATSGHHVIVSGNNTDRLQLIHFSQQNDIEVGEIVLTSSDGEFFPPNIPVGVVTKIQRDEITVKPLADVMNTDYVHIIEVESIEQREARAAKNLASDAAIPRGKISEDERDEEVVVSQEPDLTSESSAPTLEKPKNINANQIVLGTSVVAEENEAEQVVEEDAGND